MYGVIAVLLGLMMTSACSSNSPTTGEFGMSHFAVEGSVTNSITGAPVSGASIVVKVHDTSCSTAHITLFQLQSEDDGDFEHVLEFLELTSGNACVTFEVTPPGSSNLQAKTVEVPNVTVVRSTAPPDTVEVTVALEPN